MQQIEKDIESQMKTIEILRLHTDFGNIVIDKLKNLDIEKTKSKQFDEIIRILPYTINEELSIGQNYLEYNSLFRDMIPKILKSENINIHHKCKFILESNNSIYKNNEELLIDFFLNLEPFNPDSGFNDKTKIRNKIIEILIESKKIDILENIDKKKFSEFNTLFMAHIDDVFCKLLKYKKETETISRYSNSNLSQLLLVKYTLYLSTSINLLLQFNTINSDILDRHFYYKLSELLFSFLKYSISGFIYSNISINKMPKTNILLNTACKKILYETYSGFYLYLKKLIENDNYIETISKNNNFYDKTDIDKTIEMYGEIKLGQDILIKDVLTNYCLKIEENINKLSNNNEKYSKEIPNKFRDPILFNVINDPVEIPEVKQILDRYTINNHLTFSETNPFTNKPLTKKELEKYNNSVEVKERVLNFIDSFNKWKANHKI